MRILFVTNRYPTQARPGDCPCIEQQKQSLERLGCHIDVLLVDSQASRLNYARALRSLLVGIKKNRYDIVHAHYGAFCALVACIQSHVPVVVTFRGSDLMWPPERVVSQVAARRARAVIVMTAEMKRLLKRPDVEVIPYGIDLARVKPIARMQARQALGLSVNSPVVLFPYNRARSLKRYDLASAAVNKLKAHFPETLLVDVHDLPHEELLLHMWASDAMVLTSDREGAPVAIREAMACSLPIVSVDVGDVAEVIRGVDSCFIAERDPVDIASKLACALISGRPGAGRSIAQSVSSDRAAQKVLHVYHRVLDHHALSAAHVSSQS